MPKTKIQSTMRVADGAGGLKELPDLRFEGGDWPIRLKITAGRADDWFAHFDAEVSQRGWNSAGTSQLEAGANSGTLIVTGGNGPGNPELEIVWERPRDQGIEIRARPSGTCAMPVDLAKQFFVAVNGRSQAGTTMRAQRRGLLQYDGLPWRGELWLGPNIRLGPPAIHATWLHAPQIVIVDAQVDGIGWQGINSEFARLIRDLSIFLHVVVGIGANPMRPGWAWTYDVDPAGHVTNCALRPIGYYDRDAREGMPAVGSAPPVPLRDVSRPGLADPFAGAEDREEHLPGDIVQLWEALRTMPDDARDRFLRAGNAYRIARSMWPEQRTAYLAFLVVACESLKPRGGKSKPVDAYDVVRAILGTDAERKLRSLRLQPDGVRDKHLHLGDLVAGEGESWLSRHHFGDPSFDEAARAMSETTRTCLIEWLRRGGSIPLPGSAQDDQKRRAK